MDQYPSLINDTESLANIGYVNDYITSMLGTATKKSEVYSQKALTDADNMLDVTCAGLTFCVARCPVPASVYITGVPYGTNPLGTLMIKLSSAAASASGLVALTGSQIGTADTSSGRYSAEVGLSNMYFAVSDQAASDQCCSWYLQCTDLTTFDQYVVRSMCGSLDGSTGKADWATIAVTCYQTL